ncbi:hypothetical protein EDD21DRAFT_233198 [Dissophora ornata]|nr:hypothetical protein EDD21DRAFT_233198 [Dissophora ornata]
MLHSAFANLLLLSISSPLPCIPSYSFASIAAITPDLASVLSLPSFLDSTPQIVYCQHPKAVPFPSRPTPVCVFKVPFDNYTRLRFSYSTHVLASIQSCGSVGCCMGAGDFRRVIYGSRSLNLLKLIFGKWELMTKSHFLSRLHEHLRGPGVASYILQLCRIKGYSLMRHINPHAALMKASSR